MGRSASRLNLFSITPGAPFLPAFVAALLEGRLGLPITLDDPLSLARATIYLPTRRAVPALAQELARALSAQGHAPALLLPRILPLGGLEEADIDAMAEADPLSTPAIPPAIEPVRRRLILARQIERWGKTVNRACFRLDDSRFRLIPDRAAEAVDLAARLGDLIDAMHSSGVEFEALAGLDAARFDQLWSFTVEFLAIAGRWWPQILAAEGALDPAARRNSLIEAECARIRAGHLEGPVIAAGSTGSVPATARLLAAIAASPMGAVVLPGLDLGLDEESWSSIAATPIGMVDAGISHPQAMMARLLMTMSASRADVVALGAPAPEGRAREHLLSEAMRPPLTTHQWRRAAGAQDEGGAGKEPPPAALAGVAVIEATDEREEALALALALREAVAASGEDDGLAAALVTADRGLAERVCIELARWNIAVEDSAGVTLARTPCGLMARLSAEWPAKGFTAAGLLALLAGPHARLGLSRAGKARGLAALEIAALRGVRLAPGLEGLREALRGAPDRIKARHAIEPLRRLTDEDLALAQRVLEGAAEALSPLAALMAHKSLDMALAAAAHIEVLHKLVAAPEGEALALPREWSELVALLTRLAGQPGVGPQGDLADYADVVAALLRDVTVTRPSRTQPRIAILGLLEARLVDAPLMVMGGLNEGIWPPETQTDPFLNRPMLSELGLPSPERRIGQSAHDFVQGFAARRVVLSRAAKAGLTQTVPSRFWQRLQAVVPPADWAAAVRRGGDHLAIGRRLDQPPAAAPLRQPAPLAPAALQPSRLSVTEVETLYRDPYAIYARKILRLDELEPLDMGLAARDRGNLLHEIVARFAAAFPVALPADALVQLRLIADEAFAGLMNEPEVAAFWKPRFLPIARAYLEWESARRPQMAALALESAAALDVPLPGGGALRLTARADRVESGHDGQLRIIDFKSGAVPTNKMVELGISPQLTLQAAMARRVAFGAVPPGPVSEVAYVALKTPDEKGLKVTPTTEEKHGLRAMAEEHLVRLAEVMGKYRAGLWGYRSLAFPQYARADGPYAHLARVKEWSRVAGQGEEGE